MPIDRATSVAVSPLSITRRTASILNSRGNFRRWSAMGHHSFRPPLEADHGVHEIEARPALEAQARVVRECALLPNRVRAVRTLDGD